MAPTKITAASLQGREPEGVDLEQAIIDFVRADLPEHYKDIPLEDGDAMVRVGIQRARAWGFERAMSILQFVALMIEMAPNFDEQPELRAVLDRKAEGDSRIADLLDDGLTKAWEEAARHRAYDAWLDPTGLDSKPENGPQPGTWDLTKVTDSAGSSSDS